MEHGPTSQTINHLGLGPIDQISFAVHDMAVELPAYESMFGPFTVRRVQFFPEHVTYRGEPTSATLILAFGRSGDLEIELVEVVDGEAPSLEHLRRHGPGAHHVRFPVEDLDDRCAVLVEQGFEIVLDGYEPRLDVRFAYLEAPDRYGHTLFELIQYGYVGVNPGRTTRDSTNAG